MPLSAHLKQSLEKKGFIKPTEIQAKVIPMLLEDACRDIHAQAQTGTGKTLAFGIPLLQAIQPERKAVQGLIVAPTRELVTQIYDSLKAVAEGSNIALEPIYGGMSITQQISALRKGAHIVIGTPGRLNDHLRRKTLVLNDLKTLVLDEADIMLDMGFKEEVDEILALAPAKKNIWLFSATVRAGIKQLINSHMRDVQVISATKQSVTTGQVKQYFCVVPTPKRIEATLRFIEASPDFYGIIFCQTKKLTMQVTESIARKGFPVNCLHGDMKQTSRNQVIKEFREKKFSILVATDVAARGIDVADLTHVINFSVPHEYENYVHRIGRTGRAGKEGDAIIIIPPTEVYKIKRLQRAIQKQITEINVPSQEAVRATKIKTVLAFVEKIKQSKNTNSSPMVQLLAQNINNLSTEEIKNGLIWMLEEKFFNSSKTF